MHQCAQNTINKERNGLFLRYASATRGDVGTNAVHKSPANTNSSKPNEMQGYYNKWESSEERRQEQLDNIIQELGSLRLRFDDFQNYQKPPP